MATCTKITYETLKEARVAAYKLNNRASRNKRKGKAYPYTCEHCKLYHITSMSGVKHKDKMKRRNKAIKELAERVGVEVDVD